MDNLQGRLPESENSYGFGPNDNPASSTGIPCPRWIIEQEADGFAVSRPDYCGNGGNTVVISNEMLDFINSIQRGEDIEDYSVLEE